ncbi:MAG: hypothetical protein B6D46_14745 [Polyangiaceae bacterium UTPRO1]|jgi:hypothetical protein|nr:hypothetical protein [Myxococcales bacterium]OQY65095.1 MAG: hypothetical protein B6D46_14745 [Polyangiaceae bacterium UTPRO1]
MLTRREVEGELRSLGFRARARARRAERERALKFARGLLGVLLGVTLLALLGFVSFLRTPPADVVYGNSSARGEEWIGSGAPDAGHRAGSLFFTGRRTWHPNDPRSRRRHRGADD